MASTEQIAKDYYNQAMDLICGNNIEQGIDYLKMAISLYEEIGNNEQYLISLYGLSTAYSLLGLNANMIQSVLTGIRFADEHKIRGARGMFFLIICDTYLMLKDYDNAINYGLMSFQDLQENGTIDKEKEASINLVANLNLSYSYLETLQYSLSEKYLNQAIEIAKENHITSHNFTFDVFKARLKHASGDDQYVFDNMDNLMDFIKNVNVTLEDYIQDLSLLCDLFLSMHLYTNALQIAQTLEFGTVANCDNKIKLETSKMYMRIYKSMGDSEKYKDACVMYAEDDMLIHDTKSQQELMKMDTDIALSIAATPLELI